MFSFFYSAGTAGYVRGEQIADYFGGKKNPIDGYEDDTCVYVKVLPPDNPPKRTFLDIDDADRAVEYAKKHPEIGLIVNSQNSYNYLSKLLNRSDIHRIPHAHCNYERWIRPDRPVKTVGIIGSKTTFQYCLDEIKFRLKAMDLDLSYEYDYWNTYKSTEDKPGREKVCDFYKTIDLQICWRPKMHATYLKNPNKLVNAASFGIPTIAYPEEGFKEWTGFYVPNDNIYDLLSYCYIYKTEPDSYRNLSDMVASKAEEYHITKIAELYKQL